MIKTIVIQNFKIFRSFDLTLNEGLNVIVGDNEAGKSTILEAVNLCLTKRLNGRNLEYELSPYLFNEECSAQYFESVHAGKAVAPPEMLIELYFADAPGLEHLRGTMNSQKEDCPGIKVEVVFDKDFQDEYQSFIENKDHSLTSIPTEYYQVHWRSFANNSLTLRGIPLRASFIDATTIRLQSGTDFYLQDILRDKLDDKERAALNLAYRELKEVFSQNPSIQGINAHLAGQKGTISDKELTISIDASQRANWEGNLVPHLDHLPFQLVGKGEQNALKIMLALDRRAAEVAVILIEEPENHLSFSSMNKLIQKIQEKCGGKQIIVTTHSAYVLNKLGLDRLILLANQRTTSLKELPKDTERYFKKLSGYDTLRLVLAKRAILVEGPSDELIVQRAYLDKHKVLPIDAGVDVINVRGLSFTRFLDIAKSLGNQVDVVTDNDGNYKRIDEKYAPYGGFYDIKVHRSEDNTRRTLEPQLVQANGLVHMNSVFGTKYATEEDLVKYMTSNKTECALTIFESAENIVMPPYIQNAVK